jgi:hypothetical protein
MSLAAIESRNHRKKRSRGGASRGVGLVNHRACCGIHPAPAVEKGLGARARKWRPRVYSRSWWSDGGRGRAYSTTVAVAATAAYHGVLKSERCIVHTTVAAFANERVAFSTGCCGVCTRTRTAPAILTRLKTSTTHCRS